MILAADLHDKERFDAIADFDAGDQLLSDDFRAFGNLFRMVMSVRFTPCELYLDTVLFKKDWRDLSKVVAALECLLRRLLLMLAAKAGPLAPYIARTSKPRPKPARKEKPAFRQVRPDSLQARFAFAPPAPSARRKPPSKRYRPDPDKIYVSSFALASRLEALIRIYKDPKAAAQKLRRKIARHALKHWLCVRVMAEPSGLNKEHPYLVYSLSLVEADTLAANDRLLKPPD